MIGPMGIAVEVFAWTVAGGAWAVILGLPVALVIPRSRRWLLRPVTRRLKARRARALEARDRAVQVAQARRDARTAVLEHELSQLDVP